MRPDAIGTGDIGDGITLAVVGGGVLGEIGSVRQYNAVNPFDIGPGAIPDFVPALFPCVNADGPIVASMPDAQYPMTPHQRLYQWPDTGIGEVRIAGSPSVGKSYPPKEIPAGQTDWPVQPIASAPIFSLDDQTAPLMGEQLLDTESVIPARNLPYLDFRTMYKTMPWTPTVFVRVPLTGDTRKWFMAGITRNGSDGAALGSCDITVLRVDKMLVNPDVQANPVVGIAVSDASTGAYSVQVAANVPHQVLAYKTGSPDKAGITLETAMPADG